MGRRRLAAYARMAELLHNKLRVETPGAALELPPVVLLTATGIICGKATSIWGYFTRLRVLKPEDGPDGTEVFVGGITKGFLVHRQLGQGDAFLREMNSSGNMVWTR